MDERWIMGGSAEKKRGKRTGPLLPWQLAGRDRTKEKRWSGGPRTKEERRGAHTKKERKKERRWQIERERERRALALFNELKKGRGGSVKKEGERDVEARRAGGG